MHLRIYTGNEISQYFSVYVFVGSASKLSSEKLHTHTPSPVGVVWLKRRERAHAAVRALVDHV